MRRPLQMHVHFISADVQQINGRAEDSGTNRRVGATAAGKLCNLARKKMTIVGVESVKGSVLGFDNS